MFMGEAQENSTDFRRIFEGWKAGRPVSMAHVPIAHFLVWRREPVCVSQRKSERTHSVISRHSHIYPWAIGFMSLDHVKLSAWVERDTPIYIYIYVVETNFIHYLSLPHFFFHLFTIFLFFFILEIGFEENWGYVK